MHVFTLTSASFTSKVRSDCLQPIPFYIGTTRNPLRFTDRFNGGWNQLREPRIGDTSQPLAKETDWIKQHHWEIDGNPHFQSDSDFIALFNVPCLIDRIAVELFDDDRRNNPGKVWHTFLLNGLRQIFCLKQSVLADLVDINKISISCSSQGICSSDEERIIAQVTKALVEHYFTTKKFEFRYVL